MKKRTADEREIKTIANRIKKSEQRAQVPVSFCYISLCFSSWTSFHSLEKFNDFIFLFQLILVALMISFCYFFFISRNDFIWVLCARGFFSHFSLCFPFALLWEKLDTHEFRRIDGSDTLNTLNKNNNRTQKHTMLQLIQCVMKWHINK